MAMGGKLKMDSKKNTKVRLSNDEINTIRKIIKKYDKNAKIILLVAELI